MIILIFSLRNRKGKEKQETRNVCPALILCFLPETMNVAEWSSAPDLIGVQQRQVFWLVFVGCHGIRSITANTFCHLPVPTSQDSGSPNKLSEQTKDIKVLTAAGTAHDLLPFFAKATKGDARDSLLILMMNIRNHCITNLYT